MLFGVRNRSKVLVASLKKHLTGEEGASLCIIFQTQEEQEWNIYVRVTRYQSDPEPTRIYDTSIAHQRENEFLRCVSDPNRLRMRRIHACQSIRGRKKRRQIPMRKTKYFLRNSDQNMKLSSCSIKWNEGQEKSYMNIFTVSIYIFLRTLKAKVFSRGDSPWLAK